MAGLGLYLGLGLSTSLSSSAPSMSLDFTTGTLDPRITFTRASSATRVNSSGVIVTAATNAARFDYDPVTLAPKGLLIEEQRSNLCTYSEQFDNAAWAKTDLTVTANAAVAPDGTTTADRLASNAVSSQHYYRQSITYSATTYTMSLYVKYDSYARVCLRVFDGTSNFWATFNISTGATAGTVGSGVTSSIIAVGNGWYRVAMMFTAAAGSGVADVFFANTNSYSGAVFTGAVTDYIAVWGAQMEAGAFATSYIPTTSATVTRSADVASMTGANFSDWYSAAEGTFVLEGDSPGSGTRVLLSADDNTANENMEIYTSTLDPKFLVTDGGVSQADIDGGAITARTAFKIAAAYKTSDFGVSVDGGVEVADTGGTIPTVDRLRIGVDQGGNYANGHIASLAYYNTRQPTQGLST